MRNALPDVLPHSMVTHAPRLVLGSVALMCAAAVVQHTVVLGQRDLPPALFGLPGLMGVAFGLLLARALQARDQIHETSRRDALTGLLNRPAFDEALDRQNALADRYSTPFGVLVFDIDHFKEVNDTYGHDTGDAVLRTVAHLSSSQIRSTDLLSRWGGDEFALIAPSTGLSGARVLAEKIRSAVAHHAFGLPSVSITVSVGLAQYVEGDDPQSLLKRADEALYRAKRGGRNRSATMRCLRPAVIRSGGA